MTSHARLAAAALTAALAGCHRAASQPPPAVAPSAAAADEGARLASRAVALPGRPGPVRTDYIAFDPATRAVWMPTGSTGRVDVLDVATGAFRSIEGFATAEVEGRRGRRVVGPSSVTLGDGVAFVGNRGNNQVCAVDVRAMRVGGCLTLGVMPDGVALVPSAHEVWVTTPATHSLTVLSVDGLAAPRAAATVTLDGDTEGYAVDPTRGVFYTNLEDRDRTLAIDVATRRVTSTWAPGCGEEGPRGLEIDVARRFLFVACTDRVVTLDLAHDGAVLGSVATGAGVDDLDYAPARRLLYVASGATGTVRYVQVDERGGLRLVASATTARGARNAAVDADGRVYVVDATDGRVFIADPLPE
jgi:DNA-binding beta-propeller fold protein YncE